MVDSLLATEGWAADQETSSMGLCCSVDHVLQPLDALDVADRPEAEAKLLPKLFPRAQPWTPEPASHESSPWTINLSLIPPQRRRVF